MEKEFIPYEQSLDLKELGFDEPCIGFYSINNQHYDDGYFHLSTENPFSNDIEPINQSKHCVLASLYQQAFRWFREKYKELKFFIKEEDFREGLYEYDIKDVLMVSGFKTYEEAELECLKKLIEIVKESLTKV